ncbi:MAG TPA: HAD family phosphatase [Pseudomonadales bacterium]|nr:HAD family phosphatase [Pseudomonadales bacterium]
MSRPVDLVLFDFGGVFTESPFFAVEGMARDLGVDIQQFAELMFGAYHLDTDHPWHKLERGEISFDDAREGILALGKAEGMAVDPLDLLVRMAGGNLMRDTMVQTLRDIKAAGYPTAIITNNVREFRDGWRALIPVDELIDKVFDSSELGIRKPDPAIYQRALFDMGGVIPQRAVFLDDVEQNVASARDLGIHGIQVLDNPESAIRELRNLLQLK